MPAKAQLQNALDTLASLRQVFDAAAQAARGSGNMATVAEVEDRTVSIGRIFGRTFETIVKNPVATLGIAFLFGAIPSLLIQLLFQGVRAEAVTSGRFFPLMIVGIFSILASIALAMITQGALVRATVAQSEGRRASLGETLMAGLTMALPLLGLAILSGIGMLLGFMLFFVPGVILYVMWSVSAPALVEERLGIRASLRRSRALTSGARWMIFGLLLIVLVIAWLIAGVVGVVNIAVYGGAENLLAATMAGERMPIAVGVIALVTGTVFSAIWGVLLTSLYVELRAWKEGPAGAALAEVFE
jgi:hypothetical protein